MIMSNKSKATTAKTVVSAPKFSIATLRKNCVKIFGVSSSTFDGATHGIDGEYTVKEMKSVIDKWHKKEVK